ncbi:MAG: response regulator transcription factor [Chloroflexi bacterium]|nr:response regulator transcription factor [Chloroflexota bacterium]MBV9547716.1 response regulator transcription factor [Chloroflexota bacterium]
MVRTGLATFLRVTGCELVGEAGDGEEALQICEREQPDIVLMDMRMPRMDGVAATRAMGERCPSARVIALTSFPEDDLVERALSAGASGYLLKNVGAGDLAAAIQTAHAGKRALGNEAARALVRCAARPGRDLSAREREVLALMKCGLSNRRIAERLIISPSTADFHVSNILGKLGAATRTEAVAIAVQERLVD